MGKEGKEEQGLSDIRSLSQQSQTSFAIPLEYQDFSNNPMQSTHGKVWLLQGEEASAGAGTKTNRGIILFLIRYRSCTLEGFCTIPWPSGGLPGLHLPLWSRQSGSRPRPGTLRPLASWEQCLCHSTPLCSQRITQAGLSAWHDIIMSVGLFFLPEDVSAVIF